VVQEPRLTCWANTSVSGAVQLSTAPDDPPSAPTEGRHGKGRNVQLDTVADVADALDVYIEMRVRPQPKGKRARHAPIEVLAA